MFVFMGSYSGGGGGSSGTDDSQDEGSTDDHTQTGVDDYVGDDGGHDSGQNSSGGTGPAVVPGGSSGGGGGGGGGGVITEPPEGDSGEADEGGEDEDEEEGPDSPDTEEPDVEPEDDGEDEDNEDDDTVVVVQEVDALSAMSWGVQPVMKHLEECYGEETELFYKPAPVCEIDPEQEKQKWIDAGQQLGMPVDPSFWDDDPPESTELVNRAFKAAIQQYCGEDYIRALWRRAVAAGEDINDRGALIDLASDLGLDLEQFEEDLDDAQPETGDREELPFTFMEIRGKPVPKSGRVRYADFKEQFTFQGIEEQEPQELLGFVEEHGPVATPEVMEVYGIRREEAVQRLQDLAGVSSIDVGGERFWLIQ